MHKWYKLPYIQMVYDVMIWPFQLRITLVWWLHSGLQLFLYVNVSPIFTSVSYHSLSCLHFARKILFIFFSIGLLYGYSNLVCHLFHNIWRYIWRVSPSWRGWWSFIFSSILMFISLSILMKLNKSNLPKAQSSLFFILVGRFYLKSKRMPGSSN